MEKELKKILKEASRVKLSRAEKQAMKESLRLFIERNPVKDETPAHFSFFPQLILRPVPVVAIFGMLLLAGGGTSLAAESSLPGDALYPVKVDVNEKVRTFFAVSDEAEAKLAVRLAERRLQEAVTLAAEGKLTAETQAEVESRLDKHIAKFEGKARELSSRGKADVSAELSSNLEASLKTHSQVIASINIKGETEEGEGEQGEKRATHSIVISIETKLGQVQKTRVDAEAKVSSGAAAEVKAAAEGKLRAAQNKIAEARGAIERTKGMVHASATAEAEARLTLAEETVKGGKLELEAGAYAKAFVSFDRAHRLAQEAHLFINATQKFNVTCPSPMPAMPNWICLDGSTAGPACEDGSWVIKQCPSPKTESSIETGIETQGESQSWLNRLGL